MSANLAAVLHGIGDLRIEEIPMPRPGIGEALIEVESVGVCGSDTHYLTHGRVGRFVVDAPLILGHEAAGTIVDIGAEVRDLRPGDRVAIEPGIGCGRCRLCRRGHYNLCPDMRFLATPPVHGALARYITMPAANLFRIPDGMGFDEAALVEPLSVGIWACRLARVDPDDRVLVSGAGPIGLLAAGAARALGAASVTVTDVVDDRLALARAHGHDVRNVAQEPFDRDGHGFDVVLECSGNPTALRTALYQLDAGGRATMIGIPSDDEVLLPLPALHDREISVVANFRYANTWPLGLRLISEGHVDTSGLITDHFTLRQAETGLLASGRSAATVKAVIHPTDVDDSCPY